MIVIADAGPLHYLILLDKSDLLKTLFGEVVIPEAVRDELMHPRAPTEVRNWVDRPPPWVRILKPGKVELSLPLGPGECEAIALALELKAELILMDDRKARRVARARGISVTGTLGVLGVAHDRGLVEWPDVVKRLTAHGFRVSDRLLRQFLGDPPVPPSPTD